MPWIRIFRTKQEAERAKEILKEGGINAYIVEQDLDGIPISKYGVPAKFSLEVKTSEEYFKAANFLAKRIKNERTKNKRDY